jgi:hypothetical protein
MVTASPGLKAFGTIIAAVPVEVLPIVTPGFTVTVISLIPGTYSGPLFVYTS